MDTRELNAILSRVVRNAEYLGCFPRDRVPKPSRYPSSVVVNTDPAGKPGSHWVAYFMTSPGSSEFFDSYGLPPLAYRGLPLATLWNDRQLQSEQSAVCGQYCVYYLALRSAGHPISRIASSLSAHNYASNDRYVHRYYRALIGKRRLLVNRNTSACVSQSCRKRSTCK